MLLGRSLHITCDKSGRYLGFGIWHAFQFFLEWNCFLGHFSSAVFSASTNPSTNGMLCYLLLFCRFYVFLLIPWFMNLICNFLFFFGIFFFFSLLFFIVFHFFFYQTIFCGFFNLQIILVIGGNQRKL